MSAWSEVNRNNPCPICGDTSWCCFAEDGIVCKCMRVSDGAFKIGNDGSGDYYMHRVEDGLIPQTVVREIREKAEKAPVSLSELETILKVSHRSSGPLNALAARLGLPVTALMRIGAGWVNKDLLLKHDTKCTKEGAYTFPMYNVEERLVGFRLRTDDFKYTLAGGNNGFFIPKGLKAGQRLCIVEGPTDLAAALSYGLNAIGRPNNNALTRDLAQLISTYAPSSVDIIIDHDAVGSKAEASTMRGAESLVAMLNTFVEGPHRIYRPTHHKDLRQCWNEGVELRGNMEIL